MYLNFNDTENLQGKGWRKGKENINQNKAGIEILIPPKRAGFILYLLYTKPCPRPDRWYGRKQKHDTHPRGLQLEWWPHDSKLL